MKVPASDLAVLVRKPMSNQPVTFRVIDSHTGGEPTRIIVGGGPDLGGGSMHDRRARLRDRFDHYRRAICTEPRGSDVMVGGLLCEPADETCRCGVVFFNNVGYLSMCGHGTIGLVETLAYLREFTRGEIQIDTPAGPVRATRHDDGRVSIGNVASYCYRKAVAVDVPGVGRVVGDIAWGGNWFFLVQSHGQAVVRERTAALTEYTTAIMRALASQGVRGDDGGVIDHVELFGPPSDLAVADARNFVLCPGGAYDRSPCGTGTSAKLACLAAHGKLPPGRPWRQESIVGSVFEATYVVAGEGRIIPTITGRAYITADATVVVDPNDPFAHGIG